CLWRRRARLKARSSWSPCGGAARGKWGSPRAGCFRAPDWSAGYSPSAGRTPHNARSPQESRPSSARPAPGTNCCDHAPGQAGAALWRLPCCSVLCRRTNGSRYSYPISLSAGLALLNQGVRFFLVRVVLALTSTSSDAAFFPSGDAPLAALVSLPDEVLGAAAFAAGFSSRAGGGALGADRR